MLPWILCGILLLIAVCLGVKNHLMRKDIRRLGQDLREHLQEPTNTLLSCPSLDSEIRTTTAEINTQLRFLREERWRYQNGDRELKGAVVSISHDLRTPLTAICGYLELLEQEEKSETVQQYLGTIANRVAAMKALTEELFRYSVVLSADTELVMEKVNLGSVMEEAFSGMYGAFVQKGITPTISMPETAVCVSANKEALLRIINNILSNALKYSDGDLTVTLQPEGTVSFTNRAEGLSKIEVGRLFDRFYTVNAARVSTGLGLFIARHLTEQMGGSITAIYQDTCLTVTLRFPQ